MKAYYILAALILALSVSDCSKSPAPDQTAVAPANPRAPVPTPIYPDIEILSTMMKAGDTTSAAIVSDSISRARQFAELNVFITLDAEGAAARADELDQLRAGGEVLGPLHGIPLVVKDNIHVAGLPNTAGTPSLREFVPTASNGVVERLEAAGAIILGKTNLHELAFGITSNNAAFGAVKNPFDARLIPGGSSGGTASAISAGIVAAGLGTDTGGSVRIPSSLTGIVGFRPSSGRYPSTAVTPISHTRDTVGLLSRTVSDLILLDGVIVADAEPVTAIAADKIRLGVPRAFYYQNLDPETAAVVEASLTQLADAGVQLIEVEVADIGDLLERSAFPIALYEVARDMPAYLEKFGTGVGFNELAGAVASPDVHGVFAAVAGEGSVTDEVYAAALEAREQLRKNFRELFASWKLDAIIFPTTILPARPIAGSMETVDLNGEQVPTLLSYIHNTDPASIAALPGLSLPVGLTTSGLPVGMEIDGAEQTDRHLLAVARTLERIIGFDGRPPQNSP